MITKETDKKNLAAAGTAAAKNRNLRKKDRQQKAAAKES